MEQFKETSIVPIKDTLERYVFKVAIRFIDQLEPELQNDLIALFRSLGGSSEAGNDSSEARQYRD